MLRIKLSHKLDRLADELSNSLSGNFPNDPLQQVRIMVPNLDTSRWLTLQLSESLGIVGNVSYVLPSEWYWHQVRKLYPEIPDLLPSDRGPMAWMIFDILKDPDYLNRFQVLEHYLEKNEGTYSDMYRWQLASQIASVFDEYLVYRPEMLLGWERSGSSKEDSWQQDLWLLLCKQWTSVSDNRFPLNRSRLYQDLLSNVRKGELELHSPFYMFNPGLLPEPILKLIAGMKDYTDIHLFMTRPVRNIATGNTSSSELVESMGEESAGTLSMIRNISGNDPEWVEGEELAVTPSNLQLIQQSFLNDSSFPNLEQDDGTIVIRSCHSTLREVETLYGFLMKQFANDPGLTPDDVLIVTPDLQTYAPYFESVFRVREDGMPDIPFHLSGTSRQKSSGIQHAFQHLLRLPDSRFSFSDIMEFVRHPAIMESFRFSEEDIHYLKTWFADNHVTWGIHSEHRREFQQPPDEPRTWRTAMRRGWVGQLVGGTPGDLHGKTVPYHGIYTTEQELLWARFQHLIRLLISMQGEAGGRKNVQGWTGLIRRWISSFFIGGHPSNQEWTKILDYLKTLDTEAATAGFSDELPFSLFRSQLESKFDDFQAGSSVFTQGMIISSMVPVRSIPFKIIALVGLNDDVFPRKPVKPAFDLMSAYPKPGERNRKNEDRNLFLESIHAASKIHYCSYTGRSQRDDSKIPPSPILGEWIDLIQDSASALQDIVQQERLNPFSESYFRDGEGISAVCYKAASTLRENRGRKGLSLSGPMTVSEGNTDSFSLYELEQFYKNPVRAFFVNRMGVYLRGVEEEKDEFRPDTLDRHILFQHLFGWKILGMDEETSWHLLSESGNLPSGWPGRAGYQELQDLVTDAFLLISGTYGKPALHITPVDIRTHSGRVTGSLTSYSKDLFLHLNPSGVSGKHLLTSWIRHLVLSIQSEGTLNESILLFGLRRGKPEWWRYRPVSEPASYLDDLLSLYRHGLSDPLSLFPDTSYVYVDTVVKENDNRLALEKAQGQWRRVNWHTREVYGDQSDPYVVLFLGSDAELSRDVHGNFEELSKRVLKPLVEHLEKL